LIGDGYELFNVRGWGVFSVVRGYNSGKLAEQAAVLVLVLVY
jgi:hypothetical protein